MAVVKPHMVPADVFGGVTFTFFALAFLTTLLRLYTRAVVLKTVGAVGLDDYLILFGVLTTFAIALLCYYASLSYIRIYETSQTEDKIDVGSTPWWLLQWDLSCRFDGISELIYDITVPVIKCSILAFYCRVKSMSGSCTYLYILMAIMLVHGIFNFSFFLASYSPVSALWNLVTHDGDFRWKYQPILLQLINNCFQIVYDLIILALPLPFLCRIKLVRSKKIALISVYLLSFASVAMTAVRLVQSVDFYIFDTSASENSFEAFVARVFYLFWTSIEVSTLVVVANLPALYALFRRATPDSVPRGTPAYFVFSAIGNALRDGVEVEEVEEQGPRGKLEEGGSEEGSHTPEGTAGSSDRGEKNRPEGAVTYFRESSSSGS